MKHHTIEVQDLHNFLLNEKVIFASSTAENKILYINLRGSYEIWHNKEKVYETMQPYSAVDFYNNIKK